MRNRSLWYALLWIVSSFLCTLLLFFGLYLLDNKYTHPTEQPIQGVLFLDAEMLEKNPIRFLIYEWEFYRDRLLLPEDFRVKKPPLPDGHVNIGQAGGFDSLGGGNARGSATYRLMLVLPDKPADYMLELPEIYSAYRLYIGGELAAWRGEPDPASFSAAIQTGAVTFRGQGDTELLLCVTDRSGFYSGLIFPPALGLPQAMGGLLAARLVLRTALLSLSGILGGFFLLLGISLRRRNAVLYAALCLCYIGYMGYLPMRTVFAAPLYPWYSLELLCQYGMFLLVLLLERELCGIRSRAFCWSVWVSMAACFAVAFVSPFLCDAAAMNTLSDLLEIYRWGIAMVFIVFATRGFSKGFEQGPLLAGVSVLAAALVAERIWPQFEPIRFGWFFETASTILILLLSYGMCRDTIAVYRDKLRLESCARETQRQLLMQREHYEALATQIERTKTAQHDLRHHLAVLSVMLRDARYHEAEDYLKQISGLILFEEQINFCTCYQADVLLRYYYAAARLDKIKIDIEISLPDPLYIDRPDLCVVLGNLLENALETCRKLPTEARFIRLRGIPIHASLVLRMENCLGAAPEMGDTGFLSTKRSGRNGMGLSSITAVAEKYNGEARFTADEKNNVFISEILLLNMPEKSED